MTTIDPTIEHERYQARVDQTSEPAPPHGHRHSLLEAVQGQPRAVWVTAFAAVVAFMGIGLVDPILSSIAAGLDATPSEVTLLFSSYIFVQVAFMLVTGMFSARFGPSAPSWSDCC